jgi:quaternary ammonium compound-resistance protein SugE
MTGVNPWILVGVAGLLEVAWAIGLTYAQGFTRLVPSVVTVVCAGASFWLLSRAMLELPVGTAYAVWVGIGAVGAAALGIALFNEPASAGRLVGIALILAGIVTLKLA